MTSTPTMDRLPKLGALNADKIGSHVILHGWVYSVRVQGAGSLCFVDLGDGTTVSPVRCLAVKADADADAESSDGKTYGSTSIDDDAALANLDEQHYEGLSFEQLGDTSKLCLGCSVQVLGYVAEPPEGTTQTLEVKMLQLKVIGGVKDPNAYPIQKSILKKPLALRQLFHSRFRAPLLQQWMQIRSQALFAVHEFFHNEGVPLLDPNIMTANDCEGAGEVFKITPQMFNKIPEKEEEPKKKKKNKNNKDQADEQPPQTEAAPVPSMETLSLDEPKEKPPAEVGLTVSSQLPLEAIAMGTGSVYTCQKSFRAEKSDTNKHLAEFLHVEFEQYFLTLDQLMDQAERFVKHTMGTVLERCDAQYDWLNQKHAAPPECHGHAEFLKSLLDKPFIRIKHVDAIEAMLQDLKDKVQTPNEQGKLVRLKFQTLPKQGEDLGSEHEKYLVKKFGTFVFVTHWPSDIKSFYMKQVGDGTCESFDLLAPLVGELFGGSMREWRYDVLLEQMNKKNMEVASLQWFVDLRKDGTAPHGGWGMGFDRLVMFLTNASSVRDIVPYPVYYGLKMEY
jgi:asparaginyl-tRNA synthetase